MADDEGAVLFTFAPALSTRRAPPKYPERSLTAVPDGELGIVVWFFGLSLVAGFGLKGVFGVTL